ncbi:helix-turn-helix domain-containing protein, partial [Tetragenococcus halophilus]
NKFKKLGSDLMKKTKKINNRDLDVLEVLWNAEEALSANDIAEVSKISKNTVLPVLKNLLSQEYIQVDDVVLTGKTLTRKYLPAIDKEEFILNHYNINVDNLLTHFLAKDDDPEVIPKIEALIRKKKQQLKKEDKP